MKIIEPSFEILTKITGNELLDIEIAGRLCYKSENRITETSAPIFVQGLIKRGHEAVLEFSALAVRFICDRAVANELVRHRIFSYVQESTRYCDYGKEGQIQVIKPEELEATVDLELYDLWSTSVSGCEYAYNKLREKGISPQIARSVLPSCLKTEIIAQGNYRQWRHMLRLRTDKAAHPQMRSLMISLLKELKEKIPIIFDDIEIG